MTHAVQQITRTLCCANLCSMFFSIFLPPGLFATATKAEADAVTEQPCKTTVREAAEHAEKTRGVDVATQTTSASCETAGTPELLL